MKVKRTYRLTPDLRVIPIRFSASAPVVEYPNPPGLGVMDYKRREHIFYTSWSEFRKIHTGAYLRGVEPFSDDDPSGHLKDVVKSSRHEVLPVAPLYSAAPRVTP